MIKDGFWPEEKRFTKPVRDPYVAMCGACGLSKHCKSPKMPHTGQGRKRILFIAEAPGEEEDRRNVQLIGQAGQFLRRHLAQLHVDLDVDCWKTNAVICRPVNNEKPTSTMINACQANVLATIRKTHPHVIVLLGESANISLLPLIWDGDPTPVGKWVGWTIPSRRFNAWVCPTYHPSFIIRAGDNALELLFHKHLAKFMKLRGRPYSEKPVQEESFVECIYRPAKAARLIREITEGRGPTAFDYETTCLKPDWGEEAKIVSASICWGHNKVAAFPFCGDVPEAMRSYLRCPRPKIASNLKFEERWSRTKLNTRVRNWYWDTMQAAHVLDFRRGITSIKFQAFVLLGVGQYNDTIKPYIESKGTSHLNRMAHAPLNELLVYNGLDSLLEYRVAKIQVNAMREKYKE